MKIKRHGVVSATEHVCKLLHYGTYT